MMTMTMAVETRVTVMAEAVGAVTVTKMMTTTTTMTTTAVAAGAAARMTTITLATMATTIASLATIESTGAAVVLLPHGAEPPWPCCRPAVKHCP